MNQSKYFYRIFLTIIALGFIHTASAQQELAQQAYLILQTKCLDCHGPHGTFTENLVIDSASGLVDTGAVIPGQPLNSNLYARLVTADNTKRMPLGRDPLDDASLRVISDWIAAGAPSWETQYDVTFIPTDAMFTAMQQHIQTLNPFDQPFARYFTMTHLYNAGKSPEARNAYKIALAKLVNSLSWGFDIHNPHPIDDTETIFYIDLRNYDWDLRDAWTQIEGVYPYAIAFDEETQAGLRAKLANLQQTMDCDVPFVHVDWFLATASLPPLYHNILRLPETERELEQELGVDAYRNLQRDPGRRVWRAGTNDSGVSNHNRVVERHTARYGAYWKSHDFAGSTDAQNIFTHPLSFERDGGEVIFNLPNGLQAYYIADKSGTRIDVAPTEIVSDPAAKDPAVRNGLSCIGCHTKGMKTFTDQVRSAIEQTANPLYDKDYALLLYVTQDKMDTLLAEDTARYKTALEKTGGVFGGIEPVHRFYEAFQDALEAPDAAASVGLQTEDFLSQIRVKSSLQNLGLTGLTSGGNVKRDAWTQRFSEIITALNSPDTPVTTTPSTVRPIQPTPSGIVRIPDPNLRSVIERLLGKENGAAITPEDMERLNRIEADENGIRDLTGLEYATNLERIEFRHNAISDLTPLTNLIRLNDIKLGGNQITDVAPLAKLFNVEWMGLEENQITDLSPLQNLKRLNGIGISGNPVTDVSPLAGLISLEGIAALNTRVTDFSPLANLPRLQWIEFGNDPTISTLPLLTGIKTLRRLEITGTKISDISRLAELTQLTQLNLERNLISDISPLSNLKKLIELRLDNNLITDISPLSGLTNLQKLNLTDNAISDFSPLESLPEIITLNAQGNPGNFIDISAPKITKSWLWMIVSTGNIGGARAARSGVDFLARASDGEVTELKVATDGTTEGNPVGSRVWTIGEVSPTYHSNLEIMGRDTNLLLIDHANHVAYGFLALESPREQQTKMLIGSSDAVKVWLNGELVHYNFVDRYSSDYQDQAPVTLKTGVNILLVAVYNSAGRWSGFFGFTSDAEYTVLPPGPRFSLTTDTTEFQTDTEFVIHLNAASMKDLAGWQTDILFDPAILKANSIAEGNFLKQGDGQTYFRSGTIDNTTGRITGISAARLTSGGVDGDGTLLAINFTLKKAMGTPVRLRSLKAGDSNGQSIHMTSPEFRIRLKTETAMTIPAWDVNEDGKIDTTDLVLVATALGTNSPENPRLDVNGDGIVNIEDLILVATHLGETAGAAAPALVALPERLTPETLQQMLDLLRTQNDGSLAFQRAIANLEQLLTALMPKETALLANYPNPFNPETWIPYQLAEPTEVTLRIYTIKGELVRTLALGHQPAGIYQTRTRAAYWDGKNVLGEPVASGIYFYTLTASEFTSTRKMLIRQ
ncbi:MAG: leucine-rich repeat domain-containing protein [Candidatus Poribacteria bacterium]|nr:leucine-rich repeat domain-containing protein [Candidatus Poribacteria bacterium]